MDKPFDPKRGGVLPTDDAYLVQDLFGGLMREHFPNATEVQLWGSSMTFNLDKNTIIIRCAGEEKEVPFP